MIEVLKKKNGGKFIETKADKSRITKLIMIRSLISSSNHFTSL